MIAIGDGLHIGAVGLEYFGGFFIKGEQSGIPQYFQRGLVNLLYLFFGHSFKRIVN
jgi:hypothetical protein